MSKEVEEAKDWEEKNQLLAGGAYVCVPLELCCAPDVRWKARSLDLEHVKNLADNQNAASLSGRVYDLVLFSDGATADLWRALKKSATEKPGNRAALEEVINSFKMKLENTAVFYVYSGNHGLHAIRILRERYPKNSKFFTLRSHILLVDSSPQSFGNLFLLGSFANTVHHLSLKTSFAEVCQRLRQQYSNLLETHGSQVAPGWKVAVGKMQKQAQAAYNWKKGEAGLTWNISCCNGPVWSRLIKVLHGQSAHENPKLLIPRSSHHLNSMARIPDDVLIQWLEEFLEGKIGLKQFKENCVTWKVEQKMWDSVSEFGREFAIPPVGFTGDEKKWQSKLTDKKVVKNVKANYPGLHAVIKGLAWDFRTATLKTVPNPNTLARLRSWLERQKQVVAANAVSQV